MNKQNISKIILILVLSIVIILYLSLFINVNSKSYVQINKGYCDLSNMDFKEIILNMDGEWEFYPNEIKSENFTPSNSSNYIKVPQKWDNKVNKTGTYRLRLRVPKEGIYSLNLSNIFSAYNLIINNEEIIKNGVIGDSYKNEVSSWQPRVVQFYTSSKDIEIIIQVSNYHNNKGGIIDT